MFDKPKILEEDNDQGTKIIRLDQYNLCYYVKYKEGEPFLVGASPEVLKQCWQSGIKEVPVFIYIPSPEANLFGDNVHMEFLYWYTKFIEGKGRKLTIIGRKNDIENIIIPKIKDAIRINFGEGGNDKSHMEEVDVLDEINFVSIDDNQIEFNSEGKTAKEIKDIKRDPNKGYTVENSGVKIFETRKSGKLFVKILIGEFFRDLPVQTNQSTMGKFLERILHKKFKPKKRDFSFTVTGSGNGFSVGKNTCSKIVHVPLDKNVWIDPPARPIHILKQLKGKSSIDPREITHLLITHIHEDHIAGFLPMALFNKKIGKKLKVITTPTIFDQLMHTFDPIYQQTEKGKLQDTVELMPLKNEVGKFEFVDGMAIAYRYNWHPNVQTLGIKFMSEKKVIAFSGDHIQDDNVLEQAKKKADETEEKNKKGQLPEYHIESKFFDLMKFDWLSADIIVHEESGPPIHTEEKHLIQLCEQFLDGKLGGKQYLKIYIEHTTKTKKTEYNDLHNYHHHKSGDGSRVVEVHLAEQGETIVVQDHRNLFQQFISTIEKKKEDTKISPA